jgi:hypothetical protein
VAHCPDRVISTVDTQARHTRKSKSKRRDGFRGHVAAERRTGDPADGLVVLAVGRQPGAVHDLVRDGRPFVIGQHPVFGSGAHRAVPGRLRVAPLAESGLRLLQQPCQPGEIPLASGRSGGSRLAG